MILISPSMVRNPEYASEELTLARKAGKKTIPGHLKPIRKLPEGVELTLSGKQHIDLSRGFRQGMERLLHDLEPEAEERRHTVQERARRASRRVRVFVRENDLGKAITTGGTMAVGAIGALALVAHQMDERQAAALKQYRDQTIDLLQSSLAEVTLANGMTPQEYRVEFRPQFLQLLERLEATQPPISALAERHNRLVTDLRSY